MNEIKEEKRKKVLREVIRQLHAGVPPEKVKEKFKQFLEGVTPLEIAKIEQELIKEGISREEIQRLCELHLEIFREELQRRIIKVSPENPISILLEEHKIIQRLSYHLKKQVEKIQKAREVNEELPRLKHVLEELLDAEKHYLREENVLFPILERHGIKEPPAIMWMEHNKLREKKKQLKNLIENLSNVDPSEFKTRLKEIVNSLGKILLSHIFKENNILFPVALETVTEQEWRQIRKEFDEIGYCCFTPQQIIAETVKETVKPEVEEKPEQKDLLQFETGSLSKDEIEAILNTLPVDITFVDRDDTVKYFNKAEKRIFIRTKAVLGRKVQLCHPQKSVHIVNRILEAFKKGERDVAEFWIHIDGRLIHIRYFAIRDKNGKYLGTMEVTQDITDLKKIEGEKRLLDWK